jgi:hypothetical protein
LYKKIALLEIPPSPISGEFQPLFESLFFSTQLATLMLVAKIAAALEAEKKQQEAKKAVAVAKAFANAAAAADNSGDAPPAVPKRSLIKKNFLPSAKLTHQATRKVQEYIKQRDSYQKQREMLLEWNQIVIKIGAAVQRGEYYVYVPTFYYSENIRPLERDLGYTITNCGGGVYKVSWQEAAEQPTATVSATQPTTAQTAGVELAKQI